MTTPTKLWLDLETFGRAPINAGVYRYAEEAYPILCAYAIDDGPVRVWDVVPEPMPDDLAAALCDHSVEIWAHNSMFDRTVLRLAGSAIEREAARRVERWRDTMVQAMTHGLPGSLDALCGILSVPQGEAKDKDGKALIQLFCKPNARGERNDGNSHPEEWAKFKRYAGLDISAMRAVHSRLPVWNYRGAELALWHLDQRINDRGVAVDLELARCAIDAVGRARARLSERTAELTDGALASTTQRDAMLEHLLQEWGVNLPDLTADTVERRAADPDLPPELRELLAIRLQASTASVAKYGRLVKCASTDGRLRGALQYSGATRTRRWAGRLFQPQNITRGTVHGEDLEIGIEAIKAGCADLIYRDS